MIVAMPENVTSNPEPVVEVDNKNPCGPEFIARNAAVQVIAVYPIVLMHQVMDAAGSFHPEVKKCCPVMR